jgi:hypothetical protein
MPKSFKLPLSIRVSHQIYSCSSSSAHAVYMVCTSQPRIVTNNTQSEFLLKQSFLPNFLSSREKAAPEKAILSVRACARFYAKMSDRVYHNFLINWPIITKFGMQVTRLKSPLSWHFYYVQPAITDITAKKGKDCNGRVTVAVDSMIVKKENKKYTWLRT